MCIYIYIYLYFLFITYIYIYIFVLFVVFFVGGARVLYEVVQGLILVATKGSML